MKLTTRAGEIGLRIERITSVVPLWPFVAVLGGIYAVPLIEWIRRGHVLAPEPGHVGYPYQRAIFLAFIVYGSILFLARRRRLSARAVVATGAVYCVFLLPAQPAGSQDVFTSLVYGRMALRGLNPMVSAPARLTGDSWTKFALFQHTPSVYGPLWIAVCAVVVLLSAHRLWIALILLKGVVCLGVLAAAGAIGHSQEKDERAAWFSMALLWNPLVLFSIAEAGHPDGLLVGLLVLALYARRRERNLATTIILALATLLKVYCFVFLALHLVALLADRSRRERAAGHAGLVAALLAGGYAPFWHGVVTFRGLADVGGTFNETLPDELREATRSSFLGHGATASLASTRSAEVAHFVSAGLFLLCVCFIIARVLHEPSRAQEHWWLAFFTYVLVAPYFLPWHALPLIAVAFAGRLFEHADRRRVRSTLVLSATVLTGIPLVRFGIPLGVALSSVRRRRAPALPAP